ncbi:hypothetical protein G7Y89_g4967 [Cudoniella acicularis]|uniref:AB hydrolase-1 domain-containing protein n=1 Tax=Cudoniella acicularis TaxID=354080 RepID=A0A8H4W476_9HELO|nr:hypothetical protein G7Y89_g4967 [Cudoniella acicularis]
MVFNPTHAFLTTENCKLHYWYLGSGPLFIFIPGGGGHGSQYNAIMTHLSSSYTCCTFDRRGMSSSVLLPNQTSSSDSQPTTLIFSPPQQARDIAAIINTLSLTLFSDSRAPKATIFASSLGGLLGFQLAIDHPHLITHLICHEASSPMLLPDSSEHRSYIRILSGGRDDAPASPPVENLMKFFENEFLIASTYNPDWRKIVRNGVNVVVLAGEKSEEEDSWLAKGTVEQQQVLGCERWVVPGHHAGFEVEAEKFALALKEVIERLEEM